MNIKRGLQLGGAIAGIVVAAFLLAYPMIEVGRMVAALSGGIDTFFAFLFSEAMILATICLVLASIGTIVVSALLCRNPAKTGKFKNYYIMTLVAIVLNLLLFVVYLAFFQWYWGLIPVAVAGVLAATLFLKGDEAKAA